MKRLLLFLLAAALHASADDLEAKRAEAAKLIGRTWELRGKDDDEAKDVAAKATAALKELYPRLADPAALVFHFSGAVSDEDQKKTVQALEKRLSGWGAKDARVISRDRSAVIILLNEADETALGTEETETLGWPGTIEFRLEASEEARAEWKGGPVWPKGTHAFRVEGSGDTFLANEEVLLDSRAVNSATKHEADGRVDVLLTLSENGAKTMETVSSANNGRRLAIVFGSTVLCAPVIRSTVKGEVSICGKFDTDRVVAAFKAAPLPCRLEPDAVNSAAHPPKVAPWAVEPAATFADRLLKNNLIHAILEDLLRERDAALYGKILDALKPVGENSR